MGKVAIIGVGQSTFVRSYPGSIRELVFEGFKEAMRDAQLGAKDIDASVICSAPAVATATVACPKDSESLIALNPATSDSITFEIAHTAELSLADATDLPVAISPCVCDRLELMLFKV